MAQLNVAIIFSLFHNSADTVDEEDRPVHCIKVEPWARSLAQRVSGLSNSSLMRCIAFFASTPPLSPPTLSLQVPTDVQACTSRYMARFVDDWCVDDEPPAAWLNGSRMNVPPADELVEVPKQDVVMFDGDTGHLVLHPDSRDLLLSMSTHRTGDGERSVRFRTLGNDAPELETAFKLFSPRDEGSRSHMSSSTIHSGVESLRFARHVVNDAVRVFFHVPRDVRGRPLVLKDLYGRLLLDIWLQEAVDAPRGLFLLQHALARGGHTMPFYADGIDESIYRGMVQAKQDGLGIFRLPEETRRKPFRPWDVRKTTPSCTQDHVVTSTPTVHHFRYQRSSLVGEGLVYPGTSTLPGAGQGLFLRPRSKVVRRGDYLCTYATSWTPTPPGPEAG